MSQSNVLCAYDYDICSRVVVIKDLACIPYGCWHTDVCAHGDSIDSQAVVADQQLCDQLICTKADTKLRAM